MPEIATITGDFTINELAEIASVLKSILKTCNEVIIDAAGIERVDSAAIQVLIAAQKECAGSGCRLTIKKSDALIKMAELIGTEI